MNVNSRSFLAIATAPSSLTPSRLAMSRLVLQVQTLWLALGLGLHHSFTRCSEVCHLDPHPPLAKSHETGFRAYGFNVGAGEVVFLVDEFVEFDIVIEGHL